MYQKPSIAERFSDLVGLVTEGFEFLLAKEDRELALRLRKRMGPRFKVIPSYDAQLVTAKLGSMDEARAESVAALGKAAEATHGMIRALAAARNGGPRGSIDCSTLASHHRAIHSQVLLFHLRAAQALSAMQDVQNAITLLHECEPDPCAALPPEVTGTGEADAVAVESAGEEQPTGDTPKRGRAAGRASVE